MPTPSDSLINYLRTVTGAWRDDPRDDAELLTRFAEGGDEEAFKVLIGRHGPLVWRSCTRTLGDTPDAEDVFQTTFLTLARKASRLRKEPVAGWLHRVAGQAALDAKAGIRRRRKLEQHAPIEKPSLPTDPASIELQTVLDEELNRLPERLRVPLILRHLEGKTLAEAARVLGVSIRAITKRLARGEKLLRERLTGRGLGVTAVAALLAGSAKTSAVPVRLIGSTARAAIAFRNGTLTGVSTEAVEKLLRSLSLKEVMGKGWWTVLVCVGTLGVGGIGLTTWKMCVDGSNAVTPAVQVAPGTATPAAATPLRSERLDRYGDPLPDGAVARIGTARFRSGSSNYYSGSSRNSAVFLPDGKTLISIHEGGNAVIFWETATGKELRRLNGPENCQSIAVSLGGKKLAVVGEKETKIWDLDVDPPRVCALKEHQGHSQSSRSAVAFAPDGVTLAVSIAGQADIWLLDATNGELRKIVKGNNSAAHGNILSFSPDGKILAAENGLWDVATGKKQRDLKNLKHAHTLESLLFSPDGKTIVTMANVWEGGGKRHGVISLYDVSTGAETNRIIMDNLGSFISFIPDKQTLLEANGQKIRFWDIDTSKVKTSEELICNDFHSGREGRICLSQDGKRLAQIYGSHVTVCDVTTGKVIGPTEVNHDSVNSLTFASDSKRLVTLAGWNELRLWDADTGRPGQKLERYNRVLRPPLDYSSDGRINVNPLNPDKQEVLIRWDTQTGNAYSLKASLGASSRAMNDQDERFALSSDGRWQLWSSGKDFTLVDRSMKKIVRHFSIESDGFESPCYVAVSNDGRSILSCRRVKNSRQVGLQSPCQIGVWSSATDKQLMSVEVSLPDASLRTVSLSPDGRRVAAIPGREAVVRLWEVASGTEGGRLEAAGIVNSVVWSSDWRLLASGDREGVVQLWDAAANREIRRFSRHQGAVTALAFSPDRLRLASGSDDTTTLIWDLHGLSYQEAKVACLPSTDTLWDSLCMKDATKAWPAMHLLAQNPDVGLPLLREQLLRPTSEIDPNRVATLLAQLDDDSFEVRSQAVEQLKKMGAKIGSALRDSLAKKPSLEVQRHILDVLGEIGAAPSGLYPDELQAYRGVEVLERIGTPAARQVLEQLTRLPTGMMHAEEAKNALQRLAKSSPASSP